MLFIYYHMCVICFSIYDVLTKEGYSLFFINWHELFTLFCSNQRYLLSQINFLMHSNQGKHFKSVGAIIYIQIWMYLKIIGWGQKKCVVAFNLNSDLGIFIISPKSKFQRILIDFKEEISIRGKRQHSSLCNGACSQAWLLEFNQDKSCGEMNPMSCLLICTC